MNPTHDLTRNQSLVLGALSRASGPLSAYTILDHLRDEGFRAPLQVYRALDKLTELGLVHRLESINSFVACAHPHPHDTHGGGMIAFAICENCGRVDEFTDDVVEKRLSDWAREKQFASKKTTIEMRGVCSDCRSP